MTIPITPAAIPTPPPMQNLGGPAAGPTPGVEFGQKVNPQQGADATSRVGEVKPPQFKDGPNPLDQAEGIRSEIARIRADYESKVVSGELKPGDGQVQVWRMMDLQTRAQDVHFRVELVSKLVDQFAGGVKQLSQTQA